MDPTAPAPSERGTTSTFVTTGVRLTLQSGAGGGTAWVLSSANGRSLGVGAEQQDDAAASDRGFRELVAEVESVTWSVRHRGDGRGWTWVVVDVNGRTRARAVARYERHGTCQRAVLRFLATLRVLHGDSP